MGNAQCSWSLIDRLNYGGKTAETRVFRTDQNAANHVTNGGWTV
jgi:hypothetical protein